MADLNDTSLTGGGRTDPTPPPQPKLEGGEPLVTGFEETQTIATAESTDESA